MALLHTFKILVVDDQRSMRGILRQLLRSLGIDEVVEAANGAQAIELLMAAKDPDIDLIICDLFMDEMDGLTCSARSASRISRRSRYRRPSCGNASKN